MCEIPWLVNMKSGFTNCYLHTLNLLILIAWIFLISWSGCQLLHCSLLLQGSSLLDPYNATQSSFFYSLCLSFSFILFSAKKHKANFIKQDQNFPLKHDQVLLQKPSSFLPREWFSTRIQFSAFWWSRPSGASHYGKVLLFFLKVLLFFALLVYRREISDMVMKTSQNHHDSKILCEAEKMLHVHQILSTTSQLENRPQPFLCEMTPCLLDHWLFEHSSIQHAVPCLEIRCGQSNMRRLTAKYIKIQGELSQ